jgi:hypothetical protein
MNSAPNRVVLIRDPYHEPTDGPHMQFRLTYSGPLYSTGMTRFVMAINVPIINTTFGCASIRN